MCTFRDKKKENRPSHYPKPEEKPQPLELQLLTTAKPPSRYRHRQTAAMLTLKILWKEKQDIRRVQLLAVNQALAARDHRVVDNWNELAFRDLRDYVLLVFPELKDPALDVLLYYMDDDDEQVRITNDDELAEGFRLMQEMAQAAGKDPSNAVCKIIVASRPMLAASSQFERERHSDAVDAADTPELLTSSTQQKKMSDLFVDLSKVIEKWEASEELGALKRDLVSILHEPGCQEALLQIMANEKVGFIHVDVGECCWLDLTCDLLQFASILQTVTEEFQAGGDYLACLVAVAGTGNLEEIAKILLQKCPHARVQVERVLQEVQHRHNVKMMSASDFFETISTEETKEDLGPVVAVFEGDITCPDGTILAPNQPFDKVWKLRNGGPTVSAGATQLPVSVRNFSRACLSLEMACWRYSLVCRRRQDAGAGPRANPVSEARPLY